MSRFRKILRILKVLHSPPLKQSSWKLITCRIDGIWSRICLSSVRRPHMPDSLTLIFRNAVRNRRRSATLFAPTLRLLEKLNRDFGKTIVMVTHDPHAARYALKIRHLEKGVLLPEGTLPEQFGDPSDRAEGTWLHSSRG